MVKHGPPGFFLLMGAGISLLLLLVSVFIEMPAWPIGLISSRAESLIGPVGQWLQVFGQASGVLPGAPVAVRRCTS